MNAQDRRKLLARLKLVYPTLWEVKRVEYKTLEEWGHCRVVVPRKDDVPPYFVIAIDQRLDDVAKALILVHEYAHAMQWRPDHQEESRSSHHDDEFGLCWAKAHRVLCAELGSEP